ncbi:glucosylceramidase [Bryocella elongata]|uniref:Glucosylceramidase n=1 Tax=Bryocella elongata TaxID=863522 RepID=A0A1H5WMD5_9BACT|nr:glycoside hydrolase family 30 beta sandwich domain-containing protein [Bryocella elongata]SEG00642.1 glucosylceramidase [Bryocella elongata]
MPLRPTFVERLPFRSRAASALLALATCGTLASAAQKPVTVWLTTADQSSLLKQQSEPLKWHKASDTPSAIHIDDSTTYQTVDGFGHALTGGSAQLLMKMSPGARKALLQELFGNGPNDIATSYIRVSIGASDMNEYVFTYDDLAAGETDPQLAHFTLHEDEKDVIPVLKEILAINPKITILASPWTAPAWMKDNGKVKGGTLKPEDYDTYAHYLVLYLQGMQSRGIHIDAITPQNEPENPKNTPSMVLTAEQEATFIGKSLGPAISKAGLHTRIIAFDHNCDHPQYPETILKDPDSSRYTDGAGFHLYLGQISALTQVHDAFPRTNIYFTEQMVVPRRNRTTGITDSSIAQPEARVVIGAMENWSRNVLLWNLAADPNNGPHTNDGGCPMCAGAMTLDGDNVKRLSAYYTAAHASKFVPPGSIRIASNAPADTAPHVAFRTPKGKHVLLVSNPSKDDAKLVIAVGKKQAEATLPAGAVATFIW